MPFCLENVLFGRVGVSYFCMSESTAQVVLRRSLVCDMAVTSASSSVHSWVKKKQNMFKMSQPDGVLQNVWLFM